MISLSIAVLIQHCFPCGVSIGTLCTRPCSPLPTRRRRTAPWRPCARRTRTAHHRRHGFPRTTEFYLSHARITTRAAVASVAYVTVQHLARQFRFRPGNCSIARVYPDEPSVRLPCRHDQHAMHGTFRTPTHLSCSCGALEGTLAWHDCRPPTLNAQEKQILASDDTAIDVSDDDIRSRSSNDEYLGVVRDDDL